MQLHHLANLRIKADPDANSMFEEVFREAYSFVSHAQHLVDALLPDLGPQVIVEFDFNDVTVRLTADDNMQEVRAAYQEAVKHSSANQRVVVGPLADRTGSVA